MFCLFQNKSVVMSDSEKSVGSYQVVTKGSKSPWFFYSVKLQILLLGFGKYWYCGIYTFGARPTWNHTNLIYTS